MPPTQPSHNARLSRPPHWHALAHVSTSEPSVPSVSSHNALPETVKPKKKSSCSGMKMDPDDQHLSVYEGTVWWTAVWCFNFRGGEHQKNLAKLFLSSTKFKTDNARNLAYNDLFQLLVHFGDSLLNTDEKYRTLFLQKKFNWIISSVTSLASLHRHANEICSLKNRKLNKNMRNKLLWKIIK